MDRRRFVPSTEGLEGRALLASGLFGAKSPNAAPAATVPMTFAIKEHRIERLPHYLDLIRTGRYLPQDTIKQLQADLLAITTKLHAPGSDFLEGYNARLRSIAPKSSLSVDDAKGLNQSFNNVVKATGASPEQAQKLSDDMNALALNDSKSPQPVFLATNDYTVVLQTILGIGRPIRKPTVAQLGAENGTRQGVNFGITPKSQPTMVGTYDAFAQVQIIDSNGNVYGSSSVERVGATQANGEAQATGKYAITFDQPLTNGLHTFYIRAIDQYGNMSHPSRPFKLKVNTDLVHQSTTTTASVPGGPLAV